MNPFERNNFTNVPSEEIIAMLREGKAFVESNDFNLLYRYRSESGESVMFDIIKAENSVGVISNSPIGARETTFKRVVRGVKSGEYDIPKQETIDGTPEELLVKLSNMISNHITHLSECDDLLHIMQISDEVRTLTLKVIDLAKIRVLNIANKEVSKMKNTSFEDFIKSTINRNPN